MFKTQRSRIFCLARLFFLLAGMPLAAQPGFELHLLPLDAGEESLERIVRFNARPGDRAAVTSELQGVLRQLYSLAYLEASVDTLDCRDSTCLAILHLGPPYKWTALRNGNVPEGYLSQSGFRERLYRGRSFSYDQLRQVQEAVLRVAENNGYPFARVWLDSIRLEEGRVEARLFLDRGELVTFDSLTLTGDARISRRYLSEYLGLSPGAPFSRERVLRSRDRLRELPFLRPNGDPTLAFYPGRAALTLPLERKNASRFDFLIGVLPQSSTTGRMLITGSFEGELINQFGRGERLYAQFEQLRPQTQELSLAFSYPYALGLPLGADVDFALYKRDTTFLDLHLDLGFSLLFEGGNYLKAFWEQRQSNLLGVNEAQLRRQQRLPDQLDLRNSTFGLEWLRQRLDYRFNPRRGWSVLLRGGAGIKRIVRNNRIEALELGYLYDSLALRSSQYRLRARLEGYLPVLSRSTLKAGLSGGFLFSEAPVYQNEQFRLGGNRLLRGFDEEFFFATQFAVATLEYRLLISQNSYLYTFGDYAWLLDRSAGKNQTLHPLGFGAGITFETRAGLFGVSLAFGALGEQPVDFARPKVHFGYVSLF